MMMMTFLFVTNLNESSVACPTVTQNLASVTSENCSGMKIENNIVTLDIQHHIAGVSLSLMRKNKMVNKSLLNSIPEFL